MKDCIVVLWSHHGQFLKETRQEQEINVVFRTPTSHVCTGGKKR